MGTDFGAREGAAMSKPFEFEEEVAEDVQNAVDFYAGRTEGIAAKFLLALRKTYERIQFQPHASGRIYKSYRAARVQRYPYLVIYRVRRTVLQVVAIHHVKKGSFDWKKRG